MGGGGIDPSFIILGLQALTVDFECELEQCALIGRNDGSNIRRSDHDVLVFQPLSCVL